MLTPIKFFFFGGGISPYIKVQGKNKFSWYASKMGAKLLLQKLSAIKLELEATILITFGHLN